VRTVCITRKEIIESLSRCCDNNKTFTIKELVDDLIDYGYIDKREIGYWTDVLYTAMKSIEN